MDHFYLVLFLCALGALGLSTALASLLAPASFPLPRSDRRLGWVDGLRGYLALSVLVYHFVLWVQLTRVTHTWIEPTINVLSQVGAAGVGLFFMITGLVFYPRVLAGLRGSSWTSTYVSRVFRIMPLVLLSFVLIVAMIVERTGAPLDADFPVAAAKWISTWAQPPLLGYQDSGRINAFVLWSLFYEWIFYLLVLPACAAGIDLVRARSLPTELVPVAVIAAGIVAQVIAAAAGIYVRALLYIPLFGIGMLAYELQLRPRVRAALSTHSAGLLAVAALIVGSVVRPTPFDWAMPLFGFFLICVACGNDLGGLLRTRGALVLGECSFGIYLLHGILLSALFEDGLVLHQALATAELPLLLPLVAAIVVPLVITTFLVVERPAILLGKVFAEKLTPRMPASYRPNFVIARPQGPLDRLFMSRRDEG